MACVGSVFETVSQTQVSVHYIYIYIYTLYSPYTLCVRELLLQNILKLPLISIVCEQSRWRVCRNLRIGERMSKQFEYSVRILNRLAP